MQVMGMVKNGVSQQTPPIQSLDRGLVILEAVAKSTTPVSLSDLTGLLGIDRRLCIVILIVTFLVFRHFTVLSAFVVFALLWSAAAIVLSRFVDHSERGPIFWGILGLLVGPFTGARLAWRVAPRTAQVLRRHS